ncbi:MAG TPA: glycosyltransferase family 1 protein [Planctomycetota bacterium]|nr:glycosyltransferase family 1 protein [Planctomycetota bacterium]
MRIAVDLEQFFRNRAGVGRYIEGILPALTRLTGDDRFTLFRSRSHADDPGVPGLPSERVTERVLPHRRRVLLLMWLVTGRPCIERWIGEHDLCFSPGLPGVPTRARAVVVMHDLMWLNFPHLFPRHSVWLRWLSFRRVVRTCAGVITDSEASRRDIVEATGLPEGRVRAIHLGIPEGFRTRPGEPAVADTLERLGVRPPYVLTVAGDHGPKKNLEGIVRAMAALPADMRNVSLVSAGRPRYDLRALTTLITELRMSDRVTFPGRVSDEDLRRLYVGARLTVFPSFYEGFGFPIVESMALGTPVVTSNVSSMPEVAGGAALLVDPHDVDGLSTAVASLVGDDGLHARLREKGLERAREFNWERTARRTREFFAECTRT